MRHPRAKQVRLVTDRGPTQGVTATLRRETFDEFESWCDANGTVPGRKAKELIEQFVASRSQQHREASHGEVEERRAEGPQIAR